MKQRLRFTEAGAWGRRSTLEKILIVLAVLFFIAAIVFVVLFVVFREGDDDKDQKPVVDEDTCTTWDCLQTASYLSESINLTVNPCEDFYQFACGKWIEQNPLTPAVIRISQFALIEQDLEIAMRDLLGMRDPNAIEAYKKTRAFYRSCENTGAMDAKGAKPLLDLLSNGGDGLFPTLDPNWEGKNLTLNQILARVGQVGDLGLSPFVSVSVGADMKQSRQHIIYLGQPGLGLPRSYYMGSRFRPDLMLYQRLYVDLMTALGANATTAAQDAVAVVDFEIRIANATQHAAERRDREKLYKKMTLRNVTAMYPQFDWLEHLQRRFSPEGINITMDEEVVLYAKEYYDKIFNVIETTSERALLNYCLWSFVYPYSGLLGSNMRTLKETFSQTLSGATRGTERWKQCLKTTDSLFHAVTGRIYVEKYFTPRAKSKMDEMITNLKEVFKEMVQEADWMSEHTKESALDKVDAVVNQVAYPVIDLNDTILNLKLENLTIVEGEYFESYMNLHRYSYRKGNQRLRYPVNRDEWVSSAATVNAFYNPLSNAIFFPAGILHKPFFSEQFMDAMNYGGIGFVIGHELTHGFDDSGRAFDKEGNLQMWWQEDDLQRFTARAQCIMNQYSSFVEPVVNKTVNGRLTLGEDIADNGGMKEAFKAYQKLIQKRGRKEPKLPVLNYTPEQIFFISSAQVWCSNMTPQLRELYLQLDNHSPMRFRVIGPMQNNEDFSRAFDCPVGSYMNPAKKCHVW